MYKLLTLSLLSLTLAFFSMTSQGQEKEHVVLIETNMGNLKAKLYNDTPLHRDNFIRLAKSGHYNGTLFYRVVKNFVVQGGSSDSRNAISGQAIGYGKGVRIDAEIKPHHYHKKGALAAPRQPDRVNVFKESDIAQFYFVVGKKYSPEELDRIEKSINVPIMKAIQKKYYTPEKKAMLDTLRAQKKVPEFRAIAEKIKSDIAFEWANNTEKLYMDDEKRKAYTTIGGVHHLDKEYTVFGELIEGFDVLDKIAALSTDKQDRPFKDVRIISVKIIE